MDWEDIRVASVIQTQHEEEVGAGRGPITLVAFRVSSGRGEAVGWLSEGGDRF